MNEKMISIIVPAYNAEQYLSQTISSILTQTYPSFELILVNDGSTDESEKVILEWAEKDDRVVYLSQTNSGPSTARNKGLSAAAGEYVLFVDADDELKSDALTLMIKDIKESDLLIFGYENHFNNRNKQNTLTVPSVDGVFKKQDFMDCFGDLFKDNMIHYIWNKLYRRHDRFTFRFDEKVRVGEDLLFNLEVMTHLNHVSISQAIYYTHNWSDRGSITTTFDRHLFDYRKEQFEAIKAFLVTNQSYTEENRKYFQQHFFKKYVDCLMSLEADDASLSFREKSQIIEAITSEIKDKNLLSYVDKTYWEKLIVLLMKYHLTIPLYITNKGLKVIQNRRRHI